MNGYEACGYYLITKLHFTKPTYDFFKYGQKPAKVDPNKFLVRRDKFQFHKLAKSYPTKEELIQYLFAYYLYEERPEKVWAGDLNSDEGKERFLRAKKWIQAPVYSFKNTITFLEPNMMKVGASGQIPSVWAAIRRQWIDPMSIVAFETMFDKSTFAYWIAKTDNMEFEFIRFAQRLSKYVPLFKQLVTEEDRKQIQKDWTIEFLAKKA